MGDLGSIHGLGRNPGEGKGYPLQYSGLENSTDCIIHGIAKSRTLLSDFHFHFQVRARVRIKVRTPLIVKWIRICKGHRFDPWSGKIPYAVEQLSLCATATEPA